MWKAGKTAREIAEVIGCSIKTMKRELALGLVEQEHTWKENYWVYSQEYAQIKRDERSKNKGPYTKLSNSYEIRKWLENKIKNEKYSPEAALFKAKELGIAIDICVKTLYNCISSGEIDIKYKDLPRQRSWRKQENSKEKALNNKRGKSIDERPKEAENRLEYGHWEGDLVIGAKGTKHCLLTLTDRKTRQEIIRRLPSKKKKNVKNTLKRLAKTYEFKTITFDNGSEFLDWEAIEKVLKCNVYYAHPYSSWERGTNENANGIIRRWYPKGTDFGRIPLGELMGVQDWMNDYPRGIFNGKSANQMLNVA